MYSGRLAYHCSCSATRGESSASSANPTRMRYQRSGSGRGTSSKSANADGNTGAAGDGAIWAAALPAMRARASAAAFIRLFEHPLKIMQLVFVSFGILDATRGLQGRQPFLGAP